LETIMGKTLHDRVRLKGRRAFENVNPLYLALAGAFATLGFAIAAAQFLL
jgi:glyoxylate carboligase